MDSKTFVFILFSYILIILFLYDNDTSKYIPFRQQSSMVETPIFDTDLISSSNELESSQEQDLRQWMAKKEEYFKKDRERIQKICQRYNITKRKLIDKEILIVDRDHRIASCLNAKVGTTTWKNLFKELMPSNIRENLTRKATQIIKKTGHDPLNIHKQWALALKTFFTINDSSFPDRFSNQIVTIQ